MTIPIKIQCGCGQRYAFDAETVNGYLPAPVACPVCGVDGTDAANEYIARSLPSATAAAEPPSRAPVRITSVAPSVRAAAPSATAVAVAGAPRTAPLLPGQVDRPQAETEARAQIFWGDAPEEVVKFLMRQGISVAESKELVGAMFLERAKTIRRNGIKKVIFGTPMMCVPVIFYLAFTSVGFLPMKIFAVTIMLGLWGAYMALRGTIMFFAPKSEPGDVADQ